MGRGKSERRGIAKGKTGRECGWERGGGRKGARVRDRKKGEGDMLLREVLLYMHLMLSTESTVLLRTARAAEGS